MSIFKLEVDADGIAVISWDVPGASMNVMSTQGYKELNDLIDKVIADDTIKGAVITSGKKDFAGGMDLNELGSIRADAGSVEPAKNVFEATMQAHHLLRKIERAGMEPKTNAGGKPIVAALPGTAAGIGIELALSTHRVFVSDRKGAKYGLPECLVGIFPGGGGTIRMLYRVGLINALQLLSQGKMLDAKKAVLAGYVDEVVPADELLTKAKDWVKKASTQDIVKPWVPTSNDDSVGITENGDGGYDFSVTHPDMTPEVWIGDAAPDKDAGYKVWFDHQSGCQYFCCYGAWVAPVPTV